VHGLQVRRLRRRFDLDSKLTLRGVRVEVAWGCPATGADVGEESKGADVCECVGEGKGVAAERCGCGLWMLVMVELVDVEDDLVWSLRRNRRNDEMAIVEEGENDVMLGADSNRLCDLDQGFAYQVCLRENKYHFHMNDAGLPVPDKQPVVKCVATLRYHTQEIATYFVFAIPQRRAP